MKINERKETKKDQSKQYGYLKENVMSLNIKNKCLIDKSKILRNNLINLKEVNEKLNMEVLSLNNANSSLNKENSSLKKEISSLKRKNKKLKKSNVSLKNQNKRLTKMKEFINFQEFLANSYTSPIIKSPFSNEDKRIFAFMDHIGKYLRKILSNTTYNPLVSIIMPTYNQENFIQNAINSILNQSYSNFELIIINDGCTDNTVSILNSFDDDRIRIFSNDKNKGCSFARNYALTKVNGEIIMYLDSDNEWDSKFIETMVGAFIKLPDADALYSGQLLYKNFGSKSHAVRFGSYNKSLLHNHNYIDLNSFCHKSSILKKINISFDNELMKMADWDFILKISNNFKLYSVPVLLSKYYEHDSNDRLTNRSNNYDLVKNVRERNKIKCNHMDSLNKKVSIIIPNYESLNELKNCINSILSFGFGDMVDIIIVDNNSSEDVKKFLFDLSSEGTIHLISNNINYGFTFAVEQGITLSDYNSDILLLNNDAILTKSALCHMQHCAYSIPDCGIVVPHEMLSAGNKTMLAHVPYANIDFVCDTTPSRAHQNIINVPVFHDGELLELNFAPFFCTYIKRDVYKKTLGLDSELGRHYRSDRIFSDFVRHILKLKIYQAPGAFVYHKHQAATKKLRETERGVYEYMFKKNQWEPELAEKLGYEKALWDY